MGFSYSLTSNAEKAAAKIEEISVQRMHDAVNLVRNTVIDNIGGLGSGRTYENYLWTDPQGRIRLGRKRWKPHTASAPGDFPAKDTGELIQSIAREVEKTDKGVVGRVGTDKIYGPMLEFGTSKMEARPWLRKTFEETEEEVKDTLGGDWPVDE